MPVIPIKALPPKLPQPPPSLNVVCYETRQHMIVDEGHIEKVTYKDSFGIACRRQNPHGDDDTKETENVNHHEDALNQWQLVREKRVKAHG